MSSTLSYNTLQACWLFTGLLVSNIIRPHVLWWYQVLTKSTVDAVEQIKDTCAPAFVEQHSQLLMYPSIPVLSLAKVVLITPGCTKYMNLLGCLEANS
jgi:hypothetical protein